MGKTPDTELQQFVLLRIIAGIFISIAVIVGLAMIIDKVNPPAETDRPPAAETDIPHIPDSSPDVSETKIQMPSSDHQITAAETSQQSAPSCWRSFVHPRDSQHLFQASVESRSAGALPGRVT